MLDKNEHLFFALWPEDATRTQLGASANHLKQKLHPVGRWIGAHRYHLTLHFLGAYDSVPEAMVQRACDAAASLRQPAFRMRINQAGAFRNKSVPWWLGPEQTPTELKQLWRDLREALQAHSVPYDTKLRLTPHVTVLRDAEQMLATTPVPEVDWPVERFVLIHSHLGVAPQYQVLGSWPLLGPDAAKATAVQRDLWDT